MATRVVMPSLISILPRSIGIVPFGGVPPSKHWQALSSKSRAVVLSMTDALARVVVATCDEAHAMRQKLYKVLERVVVHNTQTSRSANCPIYLERRKRRSRC